MNTSKSICTVCNYVYDEEKGEPRQSIKPGTQFSSLPEEWSCPDCGQSKEMFQPCTCVSLLQCSCAPNSFSGQSKVGELVAANPARATVFGSYNIDYCCGGKRTLAEVCREKGIELGELISRLVEVDSCSSSSEQDWTKSTLKALIEHIVTCYHNPLQEQLPVVLQLAQKVARVHGEHHPEMIEVAQIFASFKDELELHMQKEELVLFPGIEKMESSGNSVNFGCGSMIDQPIAVMTAEHENAGDALSKLRELTRGYTAPQDACNSFRVLLFSLSEIETQMHQHVHKENNILFPRALNRAKTLSQPALIS